MAGGVLSKEEVQAMEDRVFAILNEEFTNSKDYVPSTRDWLSAYWSGFKGPEQLSRIRYTGYDRGGFSIYIHTYTYIYIDRYI